MRSAVHSHTHPQARTQNQWVRRHSCRVVALDPLAIFSDRVPSPLGFVLLAVLQRTVMGCRTFPVAVPLLTRVSTRTATAG